MSDAKRLRSKARELQALAAGLTDPDARRELLSLALGYAALAERVARNGVVGESQGSEPQQQAELSAPSATASPGPE